MSVRLEILTETGIKTLDALPGQNLLSLLLQNDFSIPAPCGGNGKCGKCSVFIHDRGTFTACQYALVGGERISLPQAKEMQILSQQYEHSVRLPYIPANFNGTGADNYGIAVDIGTTSMVFYLVGFRDGSLIETTTRANPQVVFGSDVISRINHGAGVENGFEILQQYLIRAFNDEIQKICSLTGADQTKITRMTVVGNTTMLHTLLGLNCLSIALAPFKPQFIESKKITASQIQLEIHPDAEVLLAPSISAYVGADIVAGLASLRYEEMKKPFLYLDIGTNGELVLVTRDKLFSCATAAGPAFEGANISHGMSAFGGAISSFSKKGYKTISNLPPVGICGSGLLDITAFLLDEGIADTEGNMEKDFIVIPSTGTPLSRDILLTRQDIREVQLAKAAIAAGTGILLKQAGLSASDLASIIIAGGFGNYLDIENAIRIGMLPDIPTEKYIQVGNAAGTGALAFLTSLEFIERMEKIKEVNEYIELSNQPDFTIDFAMNMYFPG